MNRFLKFCGWTATAFCALIGGAGLLTPQIGMAIAFIVCAIVLAPPTGRIFSRVDTRISVPVRAITLVLVLWVASATAPTTPSAPIAQSVTGPTVTCQIAGGNIWGDVKLYHDRECQRPFATVLGGGDRNGEKLVQIRFDSGEVEWKTRSAVRDQAFVTIDDPAIKAQRWQTVKLD